MRASSLHALAVMLVATGNPHRDAVENPDVFYDPWPSTQLDARLMVRGGRWRALARWRNWERREMRPATRQTARRVL